MTVAHPIPPRVLARLKFNLRILQERGTFDKHKHIGGEFWSLSVPVDNMLHIEAELMEAGLELSAKPAFNNPSPSLWTARGQTDDIYINLAGIKKLAELGIITDPNLRVVAGLSARGRGDR